MNNIILATPYARMLADQRNIDLSKIAGSGEYGSVVSRDILGYKSEVKITSVAKEMLKYYDIDINTVKYKGDKIQKSDVLKMMSSTDISDENGVCSDELNTSKENAIKASPMRKMIAKRMTESMSIAPQYTQFSEIDTTDLFDLIANTNKAYKELRDNKLSVTDFMVKLVALTLVQHPIINSSYADEVITIHKDINIGVAVALEDGLIVPVIKNSDKETLSNINTSSRMLYEKARSGKLTPTECSGGTFTISNMGMYPIDFATPIINQPESGILAIGQTKEKPSIVNGEIVIRKFTSFSLTLDHRHIDGVEGCKFFSTLKNLIEKPLSILL